MKITIGNDPHIYSGPWGFVAQVVVMALATVLAAYILPGVHVDTVWAAIATAAVIALLNNFIRPILIVLTLPFTIVSMGLFLLVINAGIILLTAGLVPNFHVNGFWNALLFSLLLTAINYLLEIPNRVERRPKYHPSDSHHHDDHVGTDDEGFTPYEEITDDNKQ